MRKDVSIGIRRNRQYDEVVEAANEFGSHRLEDKVGPHIAAARLYVNALRSLDVYGPTQKRVEEILEGEIPKSDRETSFLLSKVSTCFSTRDITHYTGTIGCCQA